LDFVLVDVEVNIRLDEQDVVDYRTTLLLVILLDGRGSKELELTLVLSPLAVAGSLVMDTGQELEVIQGDLLRFDAQFVVELALRSPLDAHNRVW
jgi:hypothetical protein